MRRVVSTLALALTGALLSGCWAQKGFDAGRTFWNPSEATITSGNVGQLVPAWDVALPGATNVGTPVSANGAVYVTTSSDDAAALDADDGGVRWTRDLTDARGSDVGDPTWSRGSLLVPQNTPPPFPTFNGTGRILHLDVRTGSTATTSHSVEGMVGDVADADDVLSVWGYRTNNRPGGIWEADIEWKFRPAVGAPLASGGSAGGYAIVGERILWSQGNGALGFSAACPDYPSGTPISGCAPDWMTALGTGSLTRPAAVGEDQVLYGDSSGGLHILDVATGAVAWTGQAGSGLAGNFVVTDDVILVATKDQRLLAFPANGCGAATCSPLWDAALGAGTHRLAAGGDVVFVAAGAEIQAFAVGGCGAATCAPLAPLVAGSEITGGPIVHEGRVVVGTAAGHVTAWEL